MRIEDIEKAILMMDEGNALPVIARHFNVNLTVLKLAVWPFIKEVG